MIGKNLRPLKQNRREILKRNELPYFRMLLFWNGTILAALIEDPLMWICMLIYMLVRIGARFGLPDFVADLGGADISVISVFLSFFLVYYVGEANNRFDKLYSIMTDQITWSLFPIESSRPDTVSATNTKRIS